MKIFFIRNVLMNLASTNDKNRNNTNCRPQIRNHKG